MIFVWWSDINFLLADSPFDYSSGGTNLHRERFLQCLRRFFPHFPLPSCCWHSCALLGKLISGANSRQTLAHQPGVLEHGGIPGIFMASLNFRNVQSTWRSWSKATLTNISIRHKRVFPSCSRFYHQLEAWLSSDVPWLGDWAGHEKSSPIIKSDRLTIKSESSSIYHHPRRIYHNITDSHILPSPPENHSSGDNQSDGWRKLRRRRNPRNIHKQMFQGKINVIMDSGSVNSTSWWLFH